MTELKHIDVLSAAKILALLALILGIIYAVIIICFVNFMPSIVALIVSKSPVFGVFASVLSNVTIALDILLLIVIPIALFIMEFVVMAVIAYVYNKLVPKIGGVKGTFKNSEIRSLDAMSVGKMIGVMGGIIILITVVISAIGSAFTTGPAAILVLVMGIVEVVIVGVIYFVGGVIATWIYNFLASHIGGIKITVTRRQITKVSSLTYAKITAILCAILGFIYGLIFSIIFLLASIEPRQPLPLAAGSHLLLTLGTYSIIIFPVAFFILGFICGIINAELYNWFAQRVGGIKVNNA
jgi:hypothetical protein